MASVSRSLASALFLPGPYLYVGSTEEEARRTLEAASTSESVLDRLAARLNTSAEYLALDEPVPAEILEAAAARPVATGQSVAAIELFRRERLTVREYLLRQPVTGPHRVFIGTPEQVAQTLEEWFLAEAADGFNIGNLTPEGLDLFVDEVIPLLQRRGLYRREYPGRTLRENFLSSA